LPKQTIRHLFDGHYEQFDLPANGFTLHLFHHGQRAGSGADHEPPAFPRDLFLHGQRARVQRRRGIFGRFFLALADSPAIDDHVVFVGDAIDADRNENFSKRIGTSAGIIPMAWGNREPGLG